MEEPGECPVLEEEEGRRWLSRTETLDSRLWGRLESEEVAPGLWRERREEDRPSPNTGDKGIRGEEKKKRKEGDGARNVIRDGKRERKHMRSENITEMVSREDAA